MTAARGVPMRPAAATDKMSRTGAVRPSTGSG
jgi:hypothetical protein